MMVLRALFLVFVFTSQIGCVKLIPEPKKPSVQRVEEPHGYSAYDIRTMARYAGYLAGLSSSGLVTECNYLISDETRYPESIGVRLHTAFVMILTPPCGGPTKAWAILQSVQKHITDRDLLSLLQYQAALANNLIVESERGYRFEENVNGLLKKNADLQTEIDQTETQLKQLKATLDALKKIEKTFHQRNGSEVP